MKAVTQNIKTGKMEVQEVPPPALRPDGILVRVRRSLISLGTERAVIELANKGMIGKARQRPDLVQKVLNKAKQEGLWNTIKVVRNLMDSPIPLGYSCSGEVIATGEETSEFRVGDHVACAGLSFANHAEIDYVPRNLAVRHPHGLHHDDAAFVTVGAIAMQGVRLANTQLGETVVVLGLGLVGQIVAQLLRCAGATVVATDPDSSKLDLALQLGAHHIAGESQIRGLVERITRGNGADSVVVCAAAKSSEPLRLAAALSRLKGRVVVVGDVGMEIERRPFFEKELELVVSRSYGPGRYDPAYEVRGNDYPFSYVRWTEQRNMQSFLELVARGGVNVSALITHRFGIGEAENAYKLVTGEVQERAIAVLLEYEGPAQLPAKLPLREVSHAKPGGPLRLGIIGAGQFCKAILLPGFAADKRVEIAAVCTSSGLTARDVAQRYSSRFCTSDPGDVISSPEVGAILIATRHDQHAILAAQAIRAGKAVFVEKPLALDPPALQEVCTAMQSTPAARLFVGYNRRFSPLAAKCREFLAASSEPMLIVYRINAGTLPSDSWVYDPKEGGGRIIGELCHFVDFVCYLTNALPVRVSAETVPARRQSAMERDTLSVTLRMADGSVATIQYYANGDPSVPKERVEVSSAGNTAILDNFRSLSLHKGNKRTVHRLFNQAKGHTEEIAAFVDALVKGKPMPISFENLVAVTQTTFDIHTSLDIGQPVDLQMPDLSSASS